MCHLWFVVLIPYTRSVLPRGRRQIVVFVFKQKTSYEMRIRDCSSDVCSSDLLGAQQHHAPAVARIAQRAGGPAARLAGAHDDDGAAAHAGSARNKIVPSSTFTP